jgi:DUF917 family protein
MSIGIEDLDDLARGSAFLGTGGGGDPYLGKLITREAFKQYGVAEVVQVDDVADDAFVCSIAGFGAPTVQLEKLICGDEVELALARLEAHLGKRVDALLPAEIGGSNSLIPLMLGSRRKLPVIDGDGMGRAFPELQMNSLSVHGVKAAPLALSDEHHNGGVVIAQDDNVAEAMTRALAVQLGLRVFIACFPMSGARMKEACIPGTLTLARDIGRVIRNSRANGAVEGLVDFLSENKLYRGAFKLFGGKIVDLERTTSSGFTVGKCVIASIDGGNDRAEIEFQNENLIFRLNGQAKAIVPDLICIVDLETADPIPTQDLRYGRRVAVIGIGAPDKMRTEAALSCFGPSAFRYDVPFVPIEKIMESD